MFWTRRSKKAPAPSDGRLPAARFLALVREALEEVAPGFTEGVVIKDDLMVSPHDWAVVLLPPQHSTGRHYDLVATPDLRLPGQEWTFADCVTAFSADERDTAASWAQTTGACLVELVDGRGHFAERVAPGDAGGVPGWGLIVSGAIGFGHDVTENRKLQGALLLANVLPRTAHTFTADLTSPHVNGVKVFYGGAPGAVQAEVRVNGERHEAASAALAALGLPEPAAPAVARYYALMLPLPENAELFADRDEDPADHADHGDHADGCGCGDACGCGGRIDPEHPGFL
ncbi:hypothetical protein Kpho02_38680 [Kitasatospora phosalacinea]|uniref:Uncharacterized protein n=1 Tax=Kitasatospora phosalacinea TaxID=2065 RepID=A0A9W6V141_9ACTN|nr:DUF6348 family protein [Kitasatospora phosalacinea]GLW71569.1 hypothetical protein Kpho02_38680 [Kitasatospora phosalacinea]